MRGKCRDSHQFEGNGATLGRGGKSVESPEDFVQFGFSNALEAGCVVDVRTADGPVGLQKIDSLLGGVEGSNDWFHRAFNVAPTTTALVWSSSKTMVPMGYIDIPRIIDWIVLGQNFPLAE